MFDLDGTLLDTLADIAEAANAALTELAFPTYPTDSYRYFTGRGMDGLIRRILPDGHRDDRTVSKCLAVAKARYRQCFSRSTKPYPGIPQLLTALEKLHLPKVVYSNKPDEFTQLMVEKLLPFCSFAAVRGQRPSVPIKPDPTAALQIAEQLNIPPADFLYLGDTDTGMHTAVAAGMYPVGALWGFRPAELLDAGAKSRIDSPLQLLTLLD